MEFGELVRTIDSTSDSKLVGLSIYYYDQIEEEQHVDTDDIFNVIDNSRYGNLSPQSIGAHLVALKQKDRISRHGEGYRLTPLGIEYYRDIIGEHNERNVGFIEPLHISNQFYTRIVEDINQSYKNGIDDAVLVLTRKLLENLVIDLLRARYGLSSSQRELFYNTNKRQFRRFSELIENIGSNISDFEYFSDRIDEGIVDLLTDLREQGNASAHSIEVSPTDEDMEEFRTQAEQAVSTLSYTLMKVRDSS